MLDPLKPQLILPEVVEPKRWKKRKLWFADPEERYVLRVYSTITGLLHINTDHVKPGDLTKAADLLQPKWRGKVATEDPTVAGSGSNTAARIYLQMGEDVVRRTGDLCPRRGESGTAHRHRRIFHTARASSQTGNRLFRYVRLGIYRQRKREDTSAHERDLGALRNSHGTDSHPALSPGER